jgi:Ca2+-binding EF-hand superfamily protein
VTRFFFYDRNFLEKEMELAATELDDDLRLLFRNVDLQKTGFVDSDQVVKCLNLIGYPTTPEQLKLEFHQFDFDKDHRMDFKEFRRFMLSKMRRTIFKMDTMVDLLKTKFKKVHPTDGYCYEMRQFEAALATISNELTSDEAHTLFFEIDQDQSGTVTLDELIQFLKTPPRDFESPLVANAILKIKKTQMLPFKELIVLYNQIAKNFCASFTRLNFMEMKNLPSEQLYPRLMDNNLAYSDIFGEYYDHRTGIHYPIKPLESDYVRVITLDSCTGIPIPEAAKLDRRNQIRGREIRAVLFDRTIHRFVGGTVIMPASWDPDYEDRWVLENPEKDCNLYVKATGDLSCLSIVFEFVMFVNHKDVDLQVSCGWAAINLDNLNKDGKFDLPLSGGAPNITTQIHADDVRTGRSTFFGKVGKFFSGEIKSELKIRVQTKQKIKPKELQMLDLLPKTILVPTEALGLWRAYRCYLGRNINPTIGASSSLGSDIVVRTFLRCVNIASFHRSICFVWNKYAEPQFINKKSAAPDFDLMVKKFEEIMSVTHPIFDSKQFNFCKTDQTLEHYGLPIWVERDNVVREAVERMRQVIMNASLHSTTNSDLLYERPFRIDEMLEDEFDQIGGIDV